VVGGRRSLHSYQHVLSAARIREPVIGNGNGLQLQVGSERTGLRRTSRLLEKDDQMSSGFV
jgi:hypothetical protein